MYEELVKRLRSHNGWALNKTLDDAADAIEELICEMADEHNARLDAEERQRWISVTERLPEEGKDVLAIVQWKDDHEVTMCYGRKYKTRWYLWNGELGELLKGFDITHWMPMPEPPKEET